MSLINTEIKPFKATAYHNGEFVPVTKESLMGKWSVVVFYPADFTFVCPTELGDQRHVLWLATRTYLWSTRLRNPKGSFWRGFRSGELAQCNRACGDRRTPEA